MSRGRYTPGVTGPGGAAVTGVGVERRGVKEGEAERCSCEAVNVTSWLEWEASWL